MFSFQKRVIVNLLLWVSYGVKTSRAKHELHTAVKAGKSVKDVEMTHCLKIWRPKKYPFLSIHGKYVQLKQTNKQKNSFQIRNQNQKIGCYILWNIFLSYFSSFSGQWGQLFTCTQGTHSGWYLLHILSSSNIYNLIREGENHFYTSWLYIFHVSLHHFIKRREKHQNKA